ncbi:hypothetical protein [Lacticaseibacillus jixiensis]|uniref:hypothetical protein n=1 Tax=Lacticaseibacillus jixiensis TaxID=3231926 RepID=UPI0036F30C33
MKNKLRGWLVALFCLCGWWFEQPNVPVQAAAPSKVLLAYDALNATENKGTNLAAVQRLLTSAKVAVKVQAISNYQPGELAKGHYQGVVTLINWPTVPIANRAFINDRAHFTGTKLHIGSNLDPAEVKAFQVAKTTLYRRQMLVKLDQATQLLPYQTDLDVLTHLPAGAKAYGSLTIQGEDTTYPGAVVAKRQGFIPYYNGAGISQLIATRVVAALFAQYPGDYQPLLLIQNVTPYSNLTQLQALADHLYAQGIPFAISATTVAKNFDLLAFRRYAKALRQVEADDGLIFMRMPAVGDPGASGGVLLRNTLTSMVTGLAQQKVFAVGWAFPTYWNRDAVFRRYALHQATTVIQLADPSQITYAKQDDRPGVFDQAYTIVAGDSLQTQKYGTPLAAYPWTFALPSAVTFEMPNSTKQRLGLQQRIADFNFAWQPTTALSGRIDIGMVTTAHQGGQYYLNGRVTDTDYRPVDRKHLSTKPGESLINRFFSVQGKLLWGFFAISLSIMGLLLLIGRRVYLNMYKRK